MNSLHLPVSGRAPTKIRVFVHSCLAFVHSCLADKKSGRNHKISGSPVAGPVFRYSTGKTGRVGKYGRASRADDASIVTAVNVG